MGSIIHESVIVSIFWLDFAGLVDGLTSVRHGLCWIMGISFFGQPVARGGFRMKRWAFLFATLFALLWLVPEADARGRGGGFSSGYKPVHVSGYTRRDGTYVRPYNRSLPHSHSGYVPLSAYSPKQPASTPEALTPKAPSAAPVDPIPVAVQDPIPTQNPINQQRTKTAQKPAPTPATIPAKPIPEAAPQPAASPTGCTQSGWCYVLMGPTGPQASNNPPPVDLSYPRTSNTPLPHVVIYRQE
jgi:hypothetical protein